MTVDLVGSTAYKMSSSRDKKNQATPHPAWVQQFRQFYRQFPETLKSKYKSTPHGQTTAPEQPGCPEVWKTIGDEILFCCRVTSVQHVACCVQAFLASLDEFGRYLEQNEIPLDVKGSGWLAAFPAENISIQILSDGLSDSGDLGLPTEDFEREVDRAPHKFDFLGTGIDTGFRISKNASTDKFTASVGLAWVLCDAAVHNHFNGTFDYHGREPFKGVNRDQPYPVVTILSERDEQKRTLRERERLVRGEDHASPLALRDFLNSFMEHVAIDAPKLPLLDGGGPIRPPESYERYISAWASGANEAEKRDEILDDGEKPSADSFKDDPLPEDVLQGRKLGKRIQPGPITLEIKGEHARVRTTPRGDPEK